MHTLLQDTVFAVRSLRRSRGFVILAVVSLGLALGVTTTMFGIVDTALNPVWAVRDGKGLATIWNAGDGATRDVSWRAKYDAARRVESLFDGMAITTTRYAFLRIGRHADRTPVNGVSPNFFAVTGIPAFRGRTFSADGADAAGDDVAMVSFRLWRVALGGERDLTDAAVTVEGRTYRVIGVLPPYVPSSVYADVFVPLRSEADVPADVRFATIVARLRDGVSGELAQERLRTLVDPVLTRAYGVGRRPFRFLVQPVLDDRPPEMDDLQKVLLASAVLILLIASGNMANLMLARGLVRERDYALCFALGARRASIVRQTLVEGLLCALAGAAVGVAIAVWAFDVVTYRMAREVPGLGAMAVSLNWRVFAFSFVVATVTSLAFALIPALRTSSVALDLPLKSGAGTTTGRVRGRYSALVIGEVALTMTLMLGASLLMKAVREMRNTEFGYDARGLLDVAAHLERSPWNRRTSVSDSVMQTMLERVRTIPGVVAASRHGTGASVGSGVTSALGVGGTRWHYLPGYSAIGPDFLRTMGVAVNEGRDFVDGDAVIRGGAILNATAARLLWPGESALGRMLKLGAHETNAPWVPIVGIADDVSGASTVMPSDDPGPQLWIVPPPGLVTMDRVLVRVPEHRLAELTLTIERVVHQTLPPGSIVVVRDPLEAFDEATLARDFVGKLFVVFAAIALGLAACGLYCLLAFVVAQRGREFAVRIALGATPRQMSRLILHDGAVMILAGTGIGAFLAMWLARALDAMLYSVFYTDALSLVVAEALLIVVALVACAVPARRAARSQPVEMLRAV